MYFFFESACFVLNDEENNVINGLFNEVMSSCTSRFIADETSATPQMLDETLLQTIVQVKIDKLKV